MPVNSSAVVAPPHATVSAKDQTNGRCRIRWLRPVVFDGADPCDDSPNAPAFYLVGCGLVSLIGVAAVPETLGRKLQ